MIRHVQQGSAKVTLSNLRALCIDCDLNVASWSTGISSAIFKVLHSYALLLFLLFAKLFFRHGRASIGVNA